MISSCKNHQNKNQFLLFLFLVIIFLILLSQGCNTRARRTKKRIESVENNLMETVVIKGLPLEKMTLQERMDFYKVPGLSLAVIDDFTLEWTRSYGFININTGEPLTVETLFQAGGLSRSVAALCVMHMMDQGKIGWNDDVNEKLRSWRLTESRFTREEKVTLKRLLTSTAGLSEISLSGYNREARLPDILDILQGVPPASGSPVRSESKPGIRMSLSGGDYIVLQQLLEDMEGKDFPSIARDIIFLPLGMTSSTFSQPLSEDLEPKAAAGHSRGGDPLEDLWLNYPQLTVSGLWTTAQDMALFLIELMEAANGRSQKIVSTNLAYSFFTPQVFNYSFGMIVDDEGEKLIAHQEGSTEGYSCHMLCYPVKGQGAVLMTNSANGAYLIEEILRSLSATYEWPHFFPEEKTLFRLDPEIYQQYNGKYEVNPEYILTVTHQDYYLIIQPTGQSPTNFYVENPTTFFSTSPYIRIRFIKDKKGEVTGLVLKQAGNEIEARKIE